MKKLIIITVCALSFYYCGKFDYEQQQLIKSGLTAKELQMFPNWLAADSVAGDARFGDLWCEIASGKEIEL